MKEIRKSSCYWRCNWRMHGDCLNTPVHRIHIRGGIGDCAGFEINVCDCHVKECVRHNQRSGYTKEIKFITPMPAFCKGWKRVTQVHSAQSYATIIACEP